MLQESEVWKQMSNAASYANALLEWDGKQPSPPLLWADMGHPRLPASEALLVLEGRLLSIANLFR